MLEVITHSPYTIPVREVYAIAGYGRQHAHPVAEVQKPRHGGNYKLEEYTRAEFDATGHNARHDGL